MKKVEKIKALTVNYFEDMSIAQVCLELERLGIEPNDFTYKANTTICLADYDEDGYWYEYQIDITGGKCSWSELVEGQVYGY